MRGIIGSILAGFLLLGAAAGQIPSRTDVTATPVPDVGHDYIHAPVETVNPANGSVSVRIGVPMPPSRGFTLPFNFTYDSNGLYYIASANGGSTYGRLIAWATNKTFLSQGGWSYSAPMISVQKTRHTVYDEDHRRDVDCSALTDYVLQDAAGNRHDLGISYFHNPTNYLCVDDGEIDVTSAGEGAIAATTTSNWLATYVNAVTVKEANGTTYQFPIHSGQPSGYACQPGHCGTTDVVAWAPSTITDKNGNQLSLSSTTTLPLQYIDTIGRTALSISSFGSSQDTINVSGLGTNSQCNASYCITWTTASASFSANLDQVGSNYCIGPGSQPAIAVVSSIALPNGKAFTFAYDGQYGTLNRLTYPSGGYVSYVWGLNQDAEFGQWPAGTDQYSTATCQYLYDNPAIIKRIVNDGSSDVLEQDFSYTTTWQSGIWTTKQTTVTTHDLVRNISYNTVYTYTWRSADNPPNTSDWPRQLPVESVIQYYGTDGALLRTVNKSWINERILSSEQTTLDTSGSVSETDWTYDPSYWYSDQNISLQSEEVIEKDEYDYGSGSHGSLLRKTFTSYAWDSDPNHSGFQTAHILDRPYKVQVIDSDGVTVDAGVTYLYDSVANLTDYQQWLNNTGSSYLDTHHGYDGYGNITSTIDPAGNPPTNYSYTDNFAVGCPGVNASSAYLTQITYPSTGVAHIEKFSYNCPSGKLASSIDQNSVPTYYQYNDARSRLTEIDYFNTGFKRYSYNDSAPSPSVTETSAITSGQQKIQTSIQDGLGHVVETDLNSDPEGTDIVKTAYDGLGLKWTQTNP